MRSEALASTPNATVGREVPIAVRASHSGAPLRAGDCIEPRLFAEVRRRAVLDGCKWDPQVGDVSTLAPFPLLLRRGAWNQLAAWAEQLAAETIRIEGEILERPELLNQLGLAAPLRRVLQRAEPLTPGAVRTMRFDFHYTTDGWRISEVNSDVPGGFTESSFFPRLVAEHCPYATPPDPAEAWARNVSLAAGPSGLVCLLSAPGFMEDHQIMAYLGKRLHAHGCQTCFANPGQITWQHRKAFLRATPLDALVRFYQGEWLPRLPRRSGWSHFIRNSLTPVTNPGAAIISESKRLPLVWDRLATSPQLWRRFLPETRQPQEVPWRTDDGWILKSAFSNTADEVCIRDMMNQRDWGKLQWEVRLLPWHWIAQRRFQSLEVDTPHGAMHACVGVYTIDGRAAGAYGRIARRALIDYAAVDVAILIEDDD